jgi:hypothetical protein
VFKNHSANAQPEYGAKNCKEALSDAEADTIIVKSRALKEDSFETTCATVDLF